MTGAFDQDAYWIARHRQLRDDPRAVGNHLRAPEERARADEVFRLRLAQAVQAAGPAGSVLDIGCGNGRAATVFCDARCDYLGLDVSPEAILIAREREPRGRYIAGSALAVDWGGPFDLVAALYVIVHFVDEARLHALLARVRSALVPGGKFLIAEDFSGRATKPAAHVRPRTLNEVRDALAMNGLDLDAAFPARMARLAGLGDLHPDFALARRRD